MLRTVDPSNVTIVKEVTSPSVTRMGYFLYGDLPSEEEPVAPARKMMGSIGSMHGDMPVIRPPNKPMRICENMVSFSPPFVCHRWFDADVAHGCVQQFTHPACPAAPNSD